MQLILKCMDYKQEHDVALRRLLKAFDNI